MLVQVYSDNMKCSDSNKPETFMFMDCKDNHLVEKYKYARDFIVSSITLGKKDVYYILSLDNSKVINSHYLNTYDSTNPPEVASPKYVFEFKIEKIHNNYSETIDGEIQLNENNEVLSFSRAKTKVNSAQEQDQKSYRIVKLQNDPTINQFGLNQNDLIKQTTTSSDPFVQVINKAAQMTKV